MPKKKDAFFLRGITEGYILQRPYFKEFNFAVQSDDDIISSLKATPENTAPEIEDKITALKKLYNRVQDYNKLIERYTRRLKRIRRRPYGDILIPLFGTLDLLKPIQQAYKEADIMLQRRYQFDLRDRMKKYRLKAGLTKASLCEMIGISPQAYYNYEKGRNDIPVHIVIKVARALKITPNDLLGVV